jgi:hypothetical protein
MLTQKRVIDMLLAPAKPLPGVRQQWFVDGLAHLVACCTASQLRFTGPAHGAATI